MKNFYRLLLVVLLTLSLITGCGITSQGVGVKVFEREITGKIVNIRQASGFELIHVITEGYSFEIPRVVLGSLKFSVGDCFRGVASAYYIPFSSNDLEGVGKVKDLAIVSCR